MPFLVSFYERLSTQYHLLILYCYVPVWFIDGVEEDEGIYFFANNSQLIYKVRMACFISTLGGCLHRGLIKETQDVHFLQCMHHN